MVEDVPVLSVISRLVDQKGLDLLEKIFAEFLISLRYGTVPIVRATGGLADTVEYTADKFLDTIERALFIYRERPDLWTELVRSAMKSDFSWSNSAQEYVKLYNIAISKRNEESLCTA